MRFRLAPSPRATPLLTFSTFAQTPEVEAATKEMAAQIQNVVGGAFEGDALAYLMSVYKDPSKPENVRIDAAKAAIRYERPAIAEAPSTRK